MATRAVDEAERAVEAEERATRIVQCAVEQHRLAARTAERVWEEYGEAAEGGPSGALAEAARDAGEREANWQAERIAKTLCCVPARRSD